MTVRRNVIANYVGQGVGALLSLVMVPVYIRYLGMEAYGLVGLFSVIQVWMGLLDLGMTPTLSREMARFNAGAMTVTAIRDLLRSLELVALGLAVLIIAAIIGASDYLSRHWLDARHLTPAAIAQAAVIMSLVIAARFGESLYRSALFGLEKQLWFNIANSLLGLFRYGGAALLLAFVAPTTGAFFLWQLLASLLTLMVLGGKLYTVLPAGDRRARFSPAALAEIRRFAGGMLGINLLAVLLTQIDKVLLSRLIPLDQFGYYMLATSVCVLLYTLTGPVTLALSPPLVVAATRGDTAAVARHYHAGAQLITVLVAPAALMLVGFGHDALLVWTGNAGLADQVAPLLGLVAIGTMCNALMQLPYFTMVAHGWTRLALVSNIVAVTLLVPLLFIVVPVAGARGAALVWIALNAGYIVLQAPLLHRRILRGELWRWYAADLALPMLAAAGTLAAALALRRQFDPDRLGLAVLLPLIAALAVLAAALAAGSVRARLAALWNPGHG